MAQASWPSPAHNSRNVTDAEYERVASRFSDDGVDGSPADTAVVSAGVGLNVTVRAGVWASVRGHAWHSGTVDDTLSVGANSSGQTRVDWVALRLDRSAWTVRAVVKAGTPGAGTPALTQDNADTGVWEIPLAYVTVPNGATSVTVTRAEQYTGSRIRPVTSATPLAAPRRGDMAYETDTGRLKLYTGSTWVYVWEDSGDVTLGSGASTWQVFAPCVGRRKGSSVTLRVSVRRITLNFGVGDTDGSHIATIPVDRLRPVRTQYFPGLFTPNAIPVRAEVRTDGEIWVRYPQETVPAGQYLELTMNYNQVA